ncbi:MAG: hypothetical protein M3198_15050 [Actinomycetota bacterium]|nr:hypothetical protein [Actinomycetota bacterium]
MDALCEACEAPLDSPLFSKCAACEIDAMVATTRRRLNDDPWERLPERWRRISQGWSGFSEDFQKELRQFLIHMYEQRADEVLGKARYDGRLAPRTFAKPDLPLDVFDDPVAQEWAELDA